MGYDQNTLSAESLAIVEQRRRVRLSPEAIAQMEALDQEISAIRATASERAGVLPPRQATLEAILAHVNALEQACREYLDDDERVRLAGALARQREITKWQGEYKCTF